MNVLITGGAGFIGSHIVDELLAHGEKVIIIDDLTSGSLANLPTDFNNNENIKFYQKDILNDDLTEIFETEKPEYCIHLAAQTSVIKSIENPTYDARMNIIATVKLLELCKKYCIKKVIVASSAAVYGMPKYLPVDENHPTEPISYYGLSKLTLEKYVQRCGLSHVVFRFSNVYGPRQASSKESGVVAIFNNNMLKNEPINIYGDGNQIRDFIYVKDIAQICYLALQRDDIANLVVNYSLNKGITINELFYFMKDIYGYEQDANYLPARAGDIRDSILQNQKAVKLFSSYELTEIKDGIIQLKNSFSTPKE